MTSVSRHELQNNLKLRVLHIITFLKGTQALSANY